MLNLRLEAEGGEQIWSFTKAVDKTRENRAFWALLRWLDGTGLNARRRQLRPAPSHRQGYSDRISFPHRAKPSKSKHREAKSEQDLANDEHRTLS